MSVTAPKGADAPGAESDGHQGGAPRVGLLLVGVLLVAANLRAPLTGVGSVLPMIEHDTGLSSTAAGLLNALPLLAFAATSPLVGRGAQRHGTERVLWIALLVLTVGIVLRSLPGVVTLFAGTVVMAAAIAYGNVLLPLAGQEHCSRTADRRGHRALRHCHGADSRGLLRGVRAPG